MTTLVAYASRHGATQGIAERIATRLSDVGIDTALRHVNDADGISSYRAIVLGAPVYDGHWPPEANAYVDQHHRALATRPLWLYSVGSFGDTAPLLGAIVRKEPRDIAAIRARLSPRDYRVFRGVVEKHQWPLPSRLLYHAFGGRFGDYRQWPVIDAWADHIAQVLLDEPAGASATTHRPRTSRAH